MPAQERACNFLKNHFDEDAGEDLSSRRASLRALAIKYDILISLQFLRFFFEKLNLFFRKKLRKYSAKICILTGRRFEGTYSKSQKVVVHLSIP